MWWMPSRPRWAFCALFLALLGMYVLLAGPALANGILVGPSGAAEPAGRRGPVSLRAHRVEAVVKDRVAQVKIEQVFHNASAQQLEGTYLLPLPEGAVVSGFSMTMGGKMVQGEVIEAAQAKRIYEGIVRQRRDPGLLEYLGRGLFRAKVFPIPAQGDLTIQISFEQVLPEDAGTLEFRYPLATDRLHGRPVESVVVDVKVESSVPLKALYSATHAVAIDRDGEQKARITYESSGRRQKQDLLLYLARSPDDVGLSVLSHRRVGEDGTFLLVLAPRQDVPAEARVPKDVVYVLDTSGSMEGEKLVQAAKSLAYGIRKLSEGDRFNVVAFSTGLNPFRETLIQATPEAKDAAVSWVQSLTAEGGTNIEDALTQAVGMGGGDRLFLTVFLTDGLPTVGTRDSNAIVKKVLAANTGKARIFTFGVGHDVDVSLLDRIAESSRGRRDYVAPGEDIEIPTSRFFRKVNRPVMSHLALRLGDGIYDVYPPTLSDLFAGEQVVVFGRYHDGGDRALRLEGRVGETQVVHEYAVHLKEGEGADFLPRLWAYRKVAFLLDQIRLHGRDPELIEAVVKLATRHGIVTPYTAGLVVEEHEMRGEPVIRDGAVVDHLETDNDLPYEENLGEDGISDAPFTGPGNNGLIGLGGGSGGAFRGRGGQRDRATGGGGNRTMSATDDGLAWLAAHQMPNGCFPAADFDAWCDGLPAVGDRPDGRGLAVRDVATTGVALCASLGAGYTNRGRHPFAKTVSKGLRYLKNVQDAEGCFGPRTHDDFLLDHAWAALAMVEAYGMTGSPIFKGSAQKAIDFLVLAQRPGGVWGPGLRTGPDDMLVTGVAMLPLKSALLINEDAVRRGTPAPLQVDPACFEAILRWVNDMTDPATGRVGWRETGVGVPRRAGLEARFPAEKSELPTAIGMLARIFAGEDPRQSETIRRAAKRLAAKAPVWNEDDGSIDELYWYFGTLAVFQAGGREWKTWNQALKTAVADSRRSDTTRCVARGSWDPAGAWGADGGRVYVTSLFTMCLEVYYRYDKVFGVTPRATGSASPAPVQDPAAAPAPVPTTGQAATEMSENLRDLKSDATGGDSQNGSDGLDAVRERLKRVGDRTFARRGDGTWIDTAWDGEGEPEAVKAYSDAWSALLAKGKDVARILAVGEHVIFVFEGKVYEVSP